MPYLRLSTNVNVSQTAPLLSKLSKLIAEQIGKPEQYVMIELHTGKPMLFAGSDAPLAYLELKSIGLVATQTKPLAKAICLSLQQQLGIATDRVYIEFSDCKAEYWGWNASTGREWFEAWGDSK
jgi:phenylpyruvate tautomerase